MPPYARPTKGTSAFRRERSPDRSVVIRAGLRRYLGMPPYENGRKRGGIWGNGTFPLPVAEEGKVPFPQPRLWRAVA